MSMKRKENEQDFVMRVKNSEDAAPFDLWNFIGLFAGIMGVMMKVLLHSNQTLPFPPF